MEDRSVREEEARKMHERDMEKVKVGGFASARQRRDMFCKRESQPPLACALRSGLHLCRPSQTSCTTPRLACDL